MLFLFSGDLHVRHMVLMVLCLQARYADWSLFDFTLSLLVLSSSHFVGCQASYYIFSVVTGKGCFRIILVFHCYVTIVLCSRSPFFRCRCAISETYAF